MAIRYYVRVSTLEQKIDRQLIFYDDADFTYIDKTSGNKRDRPELNRMLYELRPRDIVVVRSIDRLSRSTKDLIDIVEKIKMAGANLKILNLNIDTSTPIGECLITILGAIAQMEYATIRERTAEGIEIAKKAGKYKGRKKGAIALRSPESIKRFKMLYKAGLTKSALAREFNVSRVAIYKWIDTLKSRGIIR